MKYLRTFLTALALGATLATHAGEAEIRKNLTARVPQLTVEEVRKTPLPGLYEVRVNGLDIFYADEQGDYLLRGDLIDTKERRNLTEERIEKLSQVAFDKLPLKDAFKIVRGNGQRKLAVFEDPNCGYCKQFEKDMRKVDNVTIHLFLFPILGEDSTAKARKIWCSKDRAKTWNDWMQNAVKPDAPSQCDSSALERNVAFGRKHHINATPTLIFADGTRIPGAIPVDLIEKQLATAK